MAKTKYLTSPVPSDKMPGGIPYIIGNEAAERFSFYGMKGILYTFMTKYLVDHTGAFDTMSESEANTWIHTFTFAVYILTILGAILSDIFLGKYRTILFLSIIYCLGHLVLAVNLTQGGLILGLSLIALGSGGIKPCVSAHVGDQFGQKNQHLISKVFAWFYFSINLGAAASNIITPLLLEHDSFGPHWAFGVPGVLMFIATVCFWLGRHKFIHIPPGGIQILDDIHKIQGWKIIGKISIVFIFFIPFWAMFDQTASAWISQAEKLNRNFYIFELLPSQLQAANPILILILIPTFAYFIYPKINQYYKLTYLKKISAGFFLMTLSFLLVAWLEQRIESGDVPHAAWQLLGYVILTSAEIMVSITALEFAYSQAPNFMKSFIMALYLSAIALGNLFTAGVNFFNETPDGSQRLDGPAYYLFFSGVMFITAMLFLLVIRYYKEKTYIQN